MIKASYLLTFAKVAELKNITLAAEALHRSQPAISGQLKALQEAFSQSLYVRKGMGIELTELGQSLLPYAQRQAKLLIDAETFRMQMEYDQEVSLKIGASTTIANYALPTLIARFHQNYPLIKVDVQIGNTQKILNSLTTLDAAFVEGRVQGIRNTGYYPTTWQQDELIAIMPEHHPLVAQDKITLQSVSEYPLILREQGSGTREMIELAFKRLDLEIEPVIELYSTESIKEAVRVGLGIALVSKMAVETLPPSIRWKSLMEEQQIIRPLSLLLPELGHNTHWIRAFIR
ncbi:MULTISPECIES: LysR substrate-binding domain-containing protein [Thiomicrorhabdus]|uniref:LysR family transcriptional regulator n=1 Tax=Thiomicrorhabdus heinhorstiae TaxID=2748010 RepID=A0ABS0BUG5_9GAMM|nr:MULTISPECIES: LysR substrate-binding domain-containing protein [Thiomicrorhabdus]MBF6057478.1 LysR family transcriptional regulator [Thiomicrorhabdus heinhorstiae]